MYPSLFVGIQLLSLTISGATSHNHDSGTVLASNVILAIGLCSVAYMYAKKMYRSPVYDPAVMFCCVLYGIIIGEHKQTQPGELALTLVSLSLFLVCYVGVAHKLDVANTIAASEDLSNVHSDVLEA